jgi:hypothetical protein
MPRVSAFLAGSGRADPPRPLSYFMWRLCKFRGCYRVGKAGPELSSKAGANRAEGARGRVYAGVAYCVVLFRWTPEAVSGAGSVTGNRGSHAVQVAVEVQQNGD